MRADAPSGCNMHVVRTNIVIDDELLRQAMALTGARTKREAVHMALSSLIERRQRRNLLELAGELDFAPDFDHKALRELRGPIRDADR